MTYIIGGWQRDVSIEHRTSIQVAGELRALDSVVSIRDGHHVPPVGGQSRPCLVHLWFPPFAHSLHHEGAVDQVS